MCSNYGFTQENLNKQSIRLHRKVRWHGRMRGAFMPSLIFFVTFLYQDKKVRVQNKSSKQCFEHLMACYF